MLPDEGGPIAALVDRVIEHEQIAGPPHFAAELTSLIRKAYRQKRLDGAARDTILLRADRVLRRTTIDTVGHPSRVNGVAETYRLSTYDAFYLELALRVGAPVVTADGALAEAAASCGLLYK